jgi:hypothetical protein
MELASEEIQKIYKIILEHDVVDGPPELREVVAKLWPELLHKVKPPRSEMH